MSISSRWWLFAPFLWLSIAQAQESATQSNSTASAPLSTLSAEPEVSLADLIAHALQNSPQLPIARENLHAARERAAGARGLLNPTLQAVPRLLGNREAADTEVIVSQPLDVFGKRRAQATVLSAGVRSAQAQNTLAERVLVVQVKNAVAELFAAQEAENLGVSQLEVAQLFRTAAARRAAVGDVPQVQVQRADLELARTQNELTNARAERLARRAELNQIVGQAPETPLRVALPLSTDFAAVLQLPGGALPVAGTAATQNSAPTPSAPANPQNTPSAISTAGASSQMGADLVAPRAALLPGTLVRPDIIGAQATLESRQAQVRAIRRERLPDVELQVRRGSFFGQGSGSTALRAVISVPLFDLGSLEHEKKAAQAEVRGQIAQIALLRQQAATQVEQALIRLAQQRQTVDLYRTSLVPQTLDLLRKTQIGYAAGATTYLEVLDAQRTLRQVQTEYLQALVGTRIGEAALESALGAAPPASVFNNIVNPTGAAPPPGTAAPGTLPADTFPPHPVAPLNPPSSDLPGTNAPLEPHENSTRPAPARAKNRL